MTQPTRQTSRHVEAVLAALDLLDCFQERAGLSVKELAEATGLTRNRVMRLAGTLVHRGYLAFDADRKRYALGPKVLFLGKAFERDQSLVSLARPILRGLAAATGESASLYVREGLERVVLAREESTQAVRYTVLEGQRMEIYAGAGGKALLAHAPPTVVQRLLDKGLPRLTENTLADPADLARDLEAIRERGYAVSLSERIQDVGAVAAPVFDDAGRVAGALGVAGPASRMAPLMEDQGPSLIVEAARELSRTLGWQGWEFAQQRREEGVPC
jgi:DNA-binding IclR family transcriptional regulator